MNTPMRQRLFCLMAVIGFSVSACSAVKATGKVAKGVGKVGWGTAKITGKVVKTTGKAAWKAGAVAGDGARTVIYMARGRQIIPLEKKGNGYYAQVRLNRRKTARFLVDTGASQVQISRAMAQRLGINLNRAPRTTAVVAGGHPVAARSVTLNEVRVGKVRVRHVPAIVLEKDNLGAGDGLLGMSFLNHFLFQMDTQRQELILQQRVVK